MRDKKLFLFNVFLLLNSIIFAAPLNSTTWRFSIDLPEGYEYSGGDGKDSFSFGNSEGAKFDLSIYHESPGKPSTYKDIEAMAREVQLKLQKPGNDTSSAGSSHSDNFEVFEYRQKKCILLELAFSMPNNGQMAGWALCMEMDRNSNAKPLLLAMAYGPEEKNDLQAVHLSALDSLAVEYGDRLSPGPITEFCYPRETQIRVPIFGLGIDALIYEDDAEAAQALIDREYQVLSRHANRPGWEEAWKRFYRAIYRDSFDRIVNIAFLLERKLNVPARENRDFANEVLKWVQSFAYERNPSGSDFINLITAVTEGRGDCDNRSLLWAIILKQAGIQSAIMVSRHYSHAMGLADLPGYGARFDLNDQKLLVAETTANVSVGLIGETTSDIEYWLGIPFE